MIKSLHTRSRDWMQLACLPLAVMLPLLQLSAQTPAAALRTAAEVRARLAAERAFLTANSNDADARILLAYSLMDAGVADEAIEQGRLATLAAPKSSTVFSAYAWLLHHNSLAVDYGKGYHYDESLAAYRHAIELSPKDPSLRQGLADNLRYDADGIEYSPSARVDLSIEQLLYIQAHQHTPAPDVTDNLVIALLRSGQFPAVIQQALKHNLTPTLDGCLLAATAMVEGSASAIDLAQHFTPDSKRRSAALDLAAEALWTTRHYSQAAELLEANRDEHRNDPSALRRIQLFRGLQTYTPENASARGPLPVLREFVAEGVGGTLTEADLRDLLASRAYPARSQPQSYAACIQQLRALSQTLTLQTGLPPAVVVDIIMANLHAVVEPGSLPAQAQIDTQILSNQSHHFLVQEGERYRLVASSTDAGPVGEEAIYLAGQNQLPAAAALLNWKRRFVNNNTDDPLGGVLFARLWSVEDAPTLESVRVAAASLMVGSESALAGRPEVAAARDRAAAGSRRDLLTLLLASIDLAHHAATNADIDTELLLQHDPTSQTAIHLRGLAFGLSGSWKAWQAMLTTHLDSEPNDPDLMREQAAEQSASGAFQDARSTYRTLLDSGHATSADQNQYAWLSLFTATPDAAAVTAAQQAVGDSSQAFAALHTLACLYAVQGKSAQARETLELALHAAHRVEPNDAVWLTLGLLYEQYGETDAATKAYRHVKPSVGAAPSVDSYALAQMHLKSIARTADH